MKEEKIFTREEVAAPFSSSNKVKVVFEKKDGTERTMICTRDLETIPEAFRPTEKEEEKKQAQPAGPAHLFPVFDLESNGWRSFTIAKVKSITPL